MAGVAVAGPLALIEILKYKPKKKPRYAGKRGEWHMIDDAEADEPLGNGWTQTACVDNNGFTTFTCEYRHMRGSSAVEIQDLTIYTSTS
jgi:hypothetical protein